MSQQWPRVRAVRTITIFNRRSLKNGYRSGLEVAIAEQIEDAGKPVSYETDKIAYTVPEREATYTPDFKLAKQDGKHFYVEAKGRWKVDDRQKHLLIKQQYPDIDIRFVFARDNKLYKGSPTTYSQYCERHGFQYAIRTIPNSWLTEGDTNDEPKSEDPEPPS